MTAGNIMAAIMTVHMRTKDGRPRRWHSGIAAMATVQAHASPARTRRLAAMKRCAPGSAPASAPERERESGTRWASSTGRRGRSMTMTVLRRARGRAGRGGGGRALGRTRPAGRELLAEELVGDRVGGRVHAGDQVVDGPYAGSRTAPGLGAVLPPRDASAAAHRGAAAGGARLVLLHRAHQVHGAVVAVERQHARVAGPDAAAEGRVRHRRAVAALLLDHRHLLRLGVGEGERHLGVHRAVETLGPRLRDEPALLQYLLAGEEVLEAALADPPLAVGLARLPEVVLEGLGRRAVELGARGRAGIERAAHLDGVRGVGDRDELRQLGS